MQNLFKKLMIIEVFASILCVVFMFLPVVHVSCAGINENVNTWHAIFGIKAKVSKEIGAFSKFSFLCLLPYLLLIACFVINTISDNKNMIVADLAKAILFLAAAIMFVLYIRLLNYNSFFTSYGEVKTFLTPKYGHILTSICCFISFIAATLEVVRDIIEKRD